MDQPAPQPAPEVDPLLKDAADDEKAALAAYLQNRVIILNAEVRRRDQAISTLEAELAEVRSRIQDVPLLHAAPEPGPDAIPE